MDCFILAYDHPLAHRTRNMLDLSITIIGTQRLTFHVLSLEEFHGREGFALPGGSLLAAGAASRNLKLPTSAALLRDIGKMGVLAEMAQEQELG